MKIDQINIYLVRFPLAKPYTMADRRLDYFDTVLLRLRSEGLEGWGEVFPGNEPTLTAAWSSEVYECARECLVPRFLQSPNIESGEQISSLFQDIKGNRHAKALFDLAWWDMYSRSKNEPLHKTLGGSSEKDIELGLSFDRFESPDEFLEDIKRAVSDGFKRITLKIRPGWDLQVLGAVRNDHPTQMIQCDVEGSLSLERHSDTIYRFDDFMPALLEQPLSSSEFVGHAMLQDSIRTQICLDESITMPHQAEIALDLRSAGTFCLKPGKVGGLTDARAIHNMAQSSEVDCYVGADMMTSIGYRFVAALSSLPSVTRPTDYVRFEEHLTHDPGIPLKPILKPEPIKPQEHDHNRFEVHPNEQGNMVAERVVPYEGPNILAGEKRLIIELWNESGIGFEPNLEMIEQFALRQCNTSS
jgi:O-succinylbenzoate synthase